MSDTAPKSGSIGEPKSKRIPGREDVPPEAPKTESVVNDDSLTTRDLELMLVLLDTCASRGSFKVEEFSLIGGLHSKLTRILQESAK